MIHFDVELVGVPEEGAVYEVVLRQTRQIGKRNDGQDLRGNWIDPVFRDLIIQERRTACASGSIPGGRIIDRLGRNGQVAGPLRSGRNRQAVVVRTVILHAQIVAEEEGAIVDNGTTHAATEIVIGEVPARRIVEVDRKLLRDFLKNQSGLSAVETQWGTTSFLRLLNGNAEAFLERLLSEFDTSAVPGRFFEMPDYFRIGMGVNTEMFAEGLNRIGRALR